MERQTIMNKEHQRMLILSVSIATLLLIVTVFGLCSFGTDNAYEVINLYGEKIKIWGTGVYMNDSYFKAPIFIGSDVSMLVCILPLYIKTSWNLQKDTSLENYISNFGLLCLIAYYAASLSFGVTYNVLHLAYIMLFATSFYNAAFHFIKLLSLSFHREVCIYKVTRGMNVFLIIAGISLFIAWLPDIIASLSQGTSLGLIEIYTTEITYVLDMGIISPLMFITYYLIKQKKFMGYVLIRMLLKVCMVIGIMLPIQTMFQLFSGIVIPIPALLTKVMIFVVMAMFAAIFGHRLKQETKYI